jgi:hypothetical protein
LAQVQGVAIVRAHELADARHTIVDIAE